MLGNDLSILMDEMLIGIFGLLNYADLCQIMNVSKAFYVLANFDDLWRFLVFEKFEGDFKYHVSWKNTFRLTILIKEGVEAAQPFVPVHRFPGFYSDYLFQPWLCTTMKIPKNWENFSNIDRRENLTFEEFVRDYESKNLPVIITDVVKNWPAYQKWSPDYLIQIVGEVKFACQTVDMKIVDYFRYCDQQQDERPLYLFDKDYLQNESSLLEKDFESPSIFEEILVCSGKI